MPRVADLIAVIIESEDKDALGSLVVDDNEGGARQEHPSVDAVASG